MPKVKVTKKELWRAIRKQCLDCVCGSSEAVRFCKDLNCSLYPYRLGRVEKKVEMKDSRGMNTPDNEGVKAQISTNRVPK
ncbi:MAG: hypothetical protein JW871_07385 [Endomicrobiales bacterium]|nr:hypothetical protein [Endomicrobiales bacterium]